MIDRAICTLPRPFLHLLLQLGMSLLTIRRKISSAARATGVKAPLGAGNAFVRGGGAAKDRKFVQKALLAELVPAVLNDAPQLASRAELWQVFGVQEAPLRSFAFAGLLLPQARAVRRCGLCCAGTCTPVQHLSCTTSTSGPPCVQKRTRGAERSSEVRNSVRSAVFSMENACRMCGKRIFFLRLAPAGARGTQVVPKS